MTREDILKLARVVGLRSAVLLHIYDGKEGALTDQELAELQRLERFFRLAYESGAAAEREAISDEYAARLQGDLENGVRRLNEAAASEFHKKYPQLASFNAWLNERGNT
jgi:hypothetical protein